MPLRTLPWVYRQQCICREPLQSRTCSSARVKHLKSMLWSFCLRVCQRCDLSILRAAALWMTRRLQQLHGTVPPQGNLGYCRPRSTSLAWSPMRCVCLKGTTICYSCAQRMVSCSSEALEHRSGLNLIAQLSMLVMKCRWGCQYVGQI